MSRPDGDPADRHEQQLPVAEEPDELEGDLPEDAPEADAVDQQREVVLDEEDTPIG